MKGHAFSVSQAFLTFYYTPTIVVILNIGTTLVIVIMTIMDSPLKK